MTDTPIPITRAEYEAKFGIPAPRASSAPIPITRAEYAKKFGDTSVLTVNSLIGGEATPTEGAARMLVGGLSRFLPFGDEVIAGAQSLVDAAMTERGVGDSYDQRLEEIRNYQKAFRKQAPLGATAVDVGSALLMPIKSSIKGADKIFTAKAAQSVPLKLAGEGAAYGAGYGFAEGEGGFGNRLEAAKNAAPFGAATSLALGVPLVAASKLLMGANKASILARTPEEEAAAILDRAGGSQIKALPDESANPLYKYETLAEATQNPNLAQLEQSVTKSTPLGNKLLIDNQAGRLEAHQRLLADVSESAKLGEEAAGSRVRSLIEPEAEAAVAKAEELFSSIDPTSRVPLSDLRRNMNSFAGKTYQAGGMPSGITGLIKELNKPYKVRSGDKVELVKPADQSFSYMHALRRRAQKEWRDAKAFGDKDAASVANQIWRGVDDAINEAGKRGMMPLDDVANFNAAKEAFTKYADRFESGAVGAVRQKVREGQYQMGDSTVMDSVFNGSPERTRKLIEALPDKPEALDEARGLVRDQIIRATQNNDGNLSPAGFRKYLRLNREGLTAEAKNGKRLFEPDHVEALDQVANDLAFLDPGSNQSVKQLANRASKGQPTTAQAIFMAGVGRKFAASIPFGGGKFVEFLDQLTKHKQDAVNEVLARALLDKGYAKDLVSTATPDSVASVLLKTATALTNTAGKIPRPAASITSEALQRETEIFGEPKSEAEGILSRKSSLFSPENESALFSVMPEGPKKTPISNSRPDPEPTQAPLDQAFKRLSSQEQLDTSSPDAVLAKLVPAMIEQESSGDAEAVSDKGAIGLMQVLPSTAKEYHKKLGIKEPLNLKDPEQNMLIGTAYIRDLLEQFDGDIELALTAYHSGPDRVQKLLTKEGGTTLSDILPKLGPVGKKYAKSVLSRMI